FPSGIVAYAIPPAIASPTSANAPTRTRRFCRKLMFLPFTSVACPGRDALPARRRDPRTFAPTVRSSGAVPPFGSGPAALGRLLWPRERRRRVSHLAHERRLAADAAQGDGRADPAGPGHAEGAPAAGPRRAAARRRLRLGREREPERVVAERAA